jgi:hypothetical protein
VPGVIGHGLAGTVRIASDLLPPEGFLATLSCVNLRTSGSVMTGRQPRPFVGRSN